MAQIEIGKGGTGCGSQESTACNLEITVSRESFFFKVRIFISDCSIQQLDIKHFKFRKEAVVLFLVLKNPQPTA